METLETRILAGFKRMVEKRFPGCELIMFGSRARGDAESDSDLDILVILDRPVSAADEEGVSECAWEACFGQGILLSPVVVSRHAWKEGIMSSSLLAIAVKEDGVRI